MRFACLCALLLLLRLESGLAQQTLFLRITSTDGEPLPGAAISLYSVPGDSLLRVAQSIADGTVAFPDLPNGSYQARAELIGYEPSRLRVTLPARTPAHTYELRMRPSPVPIDPVTAQGERARTRFQEEAGLTVRELTRAELKLIPGLAEADVMRAVEALPGVVTTSDFSSAFNVRGGSADQNLILLDGIPIYNPFHLGGVFSVFNSDMVERAELLAGGFPAQYGGRVSSVLNVVSDAGNREFDVRAGVSVLATRVSVGGSVPGIEDSRIRVGVRRSYFDALLKPFLDFPYHLTDAQLVGEVWANPTNRIGITAYIGEDVLELSRADSFPLKVDWKWGNGIAGARWTRSFSRGATLDVRGSFSHFSTELTFPDFGDTFLASQIDHALFRADVAIPVRNHEVRAGFETNRMWYDNVARSGGTEFGAAKESGWGHAGYAQTAWRLGSTLIETGVRADIWSADEGTNVLWSPRLAIKQFFLNGDAAFKLAGGRYTQFVHSLRDEEFPVGLDVWVLSGLRAPQVRSNQVQGGFEWFGKDWYAAIESYFRRFEGVATNNFAQDPNDAFDDLLAGDGTSYGADAVIRKDRGTITGFVTLSWLKAEREFPDFQTGEENPPTIKYPPIFDRRAEVDLVLRVPLPKSWLGGLRWNFGSGLPYTRPVGSYLMYEYHIDGNHRALDEAPDSTMLAVLLGQRNAARYPAYHRLDISVRKTFTKRWGTLTPHFDVLNVYNRKNVLFYFYEYEKTPPVRSGISMFPFLPTVGVELTF
jgi:hypothetical protein